MQDEKGMQKNTSIINSRNKYAMQNAKVQTDAMTHNAEQFHYNMYD